MDRDLRPEVIALVASAGGLGALTAVLSGLPEPLEAPVVVAQHLGDHGSALVQILSRRLAVPVRWAVDSEPLEAGTVAVCPPRQVVEILPDSSCLIREAVAERRLLPLDALLSSLADSFGPSALVAVLTGMGHDGAAGAQAVRAAAGTVLVQSTDTAEHPGMPAAAIAGGAADLVLPLHEIAPAIGQLLAGEGLPRPAREREAASAVFAGDGEVVALARDIDWSQTRLGPADQWPPELTCSVQLMMASPLAMCVLWGEDFVQLYNDGYRTVMGAAHPAGLGQRSRDSRPEVWHSNAPVYDRVMKGESVALRDARYPITRNGELEDAWFDLTFVPVRVGDGAVGGVLCTVVEKTGEVLGRRRLQTLHDVTVRMTETSTRMSAFTAALDTIAAHAEDLPFAAGYLLDATGRRAQLVDAVGTAAGGAMAPREISLQGGSPAWPVAKAVDELRPMLLEDLSSRFRGVVVGEGEIVPPRAAVVAPLRDAASERVTGALVLGVNPRLVLDAPHREFLTLISAEIEARLSEAHGRQREQERLARLSELDRAKTTFFANVSHEFRTPLTLMLAPLEEVLQRRDAISPELRERVEVAHRNTQRLLRLVGSLLDFSRLEAGRMQADRQLTDLAEFTREIAAVFRSVIEEVGLRLTIDIEPAPVSVLVDREMWETIVANLLSNALKFTLEGSIILELRRVGQHVELRVSDTGRGIPRLELPQLFQRFHRVESGPARAHEGAGIGLALVDEMVRRHHGRVRVQSEPGQGSTFTVWMPMAPDIDGAPRGERIGATLTGAARALADEASRWEAGQPPSVWPAEAPVAPVSAGRSLPRAEILVVEVNADMRDYIARLLSDHWPVRVAASGAEALAMLRERPADLVVADVMIPGMDGFALLREIRSTDELGDLPVILVTARPDEEPAVDGLLAGANDYITKPFSARELIARVTAQVELAGVRRAAEARFTALIEASWDVVYRMSPDWSEMRGLDGRGFISDTEKPSRTWLHEYITPDDRPRVRRAIQEAIERRSVFELEHDVVRADGSRGRAYSRAVPLLDENGEIVEWVGAARDITAPAEEIARPDARPRAKRSIRG